MWFSCKHPAKYLHVEKEATVEIVDEDFEQITYHLYCVKCLTPVEVKFAKLIGGVKGFIERGRK